MSEKIPYDSPYENDKEYTPEEIEKLNFARLKEEERLSQPETVINTGGKLTGPKTRIGKFFGVDKFEHPHGEEIGGAYRHKGELIDVSAYEKQEARKDGEAREQMSEEEWKHYESIRDILRKLRAIDVPSREQQFVVVYGKGQNDFHSGWIVGISDNRSELYLNRVDRAGDDNPDKIKIADITKIEARQPR